MKLKFKKKFPITLPYGVLQTTKVIFSITLIMILECMCHDCSSINVISFLIWFFGIFSILSFVAHLLDVQQNLSNKPNVFIYIPFAFLDFLIGTIATVTYIIGIILFIVSFLQDHNDSTQTLFGYILGIINCIILISLYGYYSFMLYRKSPNRKILSIRTIIVEGDNIKYVNLPTLQNISLNSPSDTISEKTCTQKIHTFDLNTKS